MATVLLVILSIGLMTAIVLAFIDIENEVYPNMKTQRAVGNIVVTGTYCIGGLLLVALVLIAIRFVVTQAPPI